MLAKKVELQQAINLRLKGKSYSEIVDIVRVSKSTLSLWLRNVTLEESSKRILEGKKYQGQRKGGLAKKNYRLISQRNIELKALKEIDYISERELWLLGIIAYWCGGSKQKEQNISQRVIFSNSDPILLKLFIKWLKEICRIEKNDILHSIYIHESGDMNKALVYWSETLNVSKNKFSRTIIKRHIMKTNRKNIGNSYNGLVRIAVRRSTNLNRKIKGWVLGINNFI